MLTLVVAEPVVNVVDSCFQVELDVHVLLLDAPVPESPIYAKSPSTHAESV